jgi:choline dehydrogenase-like flavoprotein
MPNRSARVNNLIRQGGLGNDPKKSVLNAFCQSHDVENLLVTDGSCFVSSACQNPTLTMMAITVRACDHLVERFRHNEV